MCICPFLYFYLYLVYSVYLQSLYVGCRHSIMIIPPHYICAL